MRCFVEIESDLESLKLLKRSLVPFAPCSVYQLDCGLARLEAHAGSEPDVLLALLDEAMGELESGGRSFNVYVRNLNRSEPPGWEACKEIRVGGLVISPVCKRALEPGPRRVLLKSGRAFGTGLHPTTYLCLSFLTELSLDGGLAADIGCGSGILALSALRLGAGKAVGLDIDPCAVRTARANARLNRLDGSFNVICGGIMSLSPCFELIMANLSAAPLFAAAPHMAGLICPGGRAVLSGFGPGQWDRLRSRMAADGFEIDSYREHQGWCGAVLKA